MQLQRFQRKMKKGVKQRDKHLYPDFLGFKIYLGDQDIPPVLSTCFFGVHISLPVLSI